MSFRSLPGSRFTPDTPFRETPLQSQNIPRLCRERAGELARAFFQVFRNPPPLALSALTGLTKKTRPANAKEVAQWMSAEETLRWPGKIHSLGKNYSFQG